MNFFNGGGNCDCLWLLILLCCCGKKGNGCGCDICECLPLLLILCCCCGDKEPGPHGICR